jgi:hypothetical protein
MAGRASAELEETDPDSRETKVQEVAWATGNGEREGEIFDYTGGRYLWAENERLRDRHCVFDIAELQCVVADAMGAQRCLIGENRRGFRL